MSLNPMLRVRQSAYRKTFNNPEGRKVLADLRRFCRASVPFADVNNVQATFLLAGRNEVWCRLMAHLQLTDDDVFKLIEEYPNE
jgi:hypothetical protein